MIRNEGTVDSQNAIVVLFICLHYGGMQLIKMKAIKISPSANKFQTFGPNFPPLMRNCVDCTNLHSKKSRNINSGFHLLLLPLHFSYIP